MKCNVCKIYGCLRPLIFYWRYNYVELAEFRTRQQQPSRNLARHYGSTRASYSSPSLFAQPCRCLLYWLCCEFLFQNMPVLTSKTLFSGDNHIDPDDLGRAEVNNFHSNVDAQLRAHFKWKNKATAAIGLSLSPDNSKVTNGVFLTRGNTGLKEQWIDFKLKRALTFI